LFLQRNLLNLIHLVKTMNDYNQNPPAYTETILKNQNVIFKIKAKPSTNKVNIWLLEVTFLCLALFISFKSLNKLINLENQEFEISTSFLQNNIEVFLPVGLLLFFIIISSLIFTVKQIQLLSHDKNFPWFIGSDNFLLIASKEDSVPIPWNYLSRNIKHSTNKTGNISIPFDRKEFAKEAKKHFPALVKNYTLRLNNVPNPTLIAEICKTKIN